MLHINITIISDAYRDASGSDPSKAFRAADSSICKSLVFSFDMMGCYGLATVRQRGSATQYEYD